jgi:hypothetical protein
MTAPLKGSWRERPQSDPHSIPASSLHLGHTGNRWGSRTGWNLYP